MALIANSGQQAPHVRQDNVNAKDLASLHGDSAAKRQAVTELLFFASVGDLTRCQKIVNTWCIQVSDPTCCDYDRRTPLHLAAAEGAFSVVEWLLTELKVGVNPIDRFKRTPLEDAVRGDHGELAALLIKHGGCVLDKRGHLVELAESHLSRNVRIWGDDFDPDWEVDPATLQLQEKLGEGEFGVVYKARWHGTTVAVKCLKDTNAVALGDFRTELNVLQKVHHPYTVQFLGAVTKQNPYMIVTEYMPGGSLADVLRSPDPAAISMRRAVELALDTARGMAYLHSRKPQAVIHRDLKPANLMIGGPYMRGSTTKRQLITSIGVVKIADFGLSKSIKLNIKSKNKHSARDLAELKQPPEGAGDPANGIKQGSLSYKMTGETGSYRYMAPEVFRHEPYNNKVDVYAFAMISYQLFEGTAPFWMLDPISAAKAASLEHRRPSWGQSGRFGRAEVPERLRTLVEQCWDKNYEARPEFEDIIEILEDVLSTMPAENGGKQGCSGCSVQ